MNKTITHLRRKSTRPWGTTICRTPFKRRTCRFADHPRTIPVPGGEFTAHEIATMQRLERRAENEARLAAMRKEGVPLPGSKPTPATVKR